MRILLIAPRFHTNLYYQVKALQKDNNEVRVLVVYRGKSEYYDGVDVKCLGLHPVFLFLEKFLVLLKKTALKSSWQMRLEVPSSKRIHEEICSFGPDYLILKAYQNNLAHKALKVSQKEGLKTIILTQTKKGYIFRSGFLFKKYVTWIKNKGGIAFISPIRKTFEVFKEAGMEAVYLPFIHPVDSFKKDYFAENRINLISVGKFVPRKDQLILLSAIKDLRGKFDLKLILVGEKADDDYYSEIKKFIKDNKLSDIVEIKFNVEYSQMSNEYKANDLFILPSYSEPAAYSIVEAMANKLPVICSSDCGTKCYINKGFNGYIFRARDVSDLKNKITKIVKERALIKKMGNNSYDLAKKNHSEENFLRKINKIIK